MTAEELVPVLVSEPTYIYLVWYHEGTDGYLFGRGDGKRFIAAYASEEDARANVGAYQFFTKVEVK